jgi:RHS repeat-associated protein
MNFEEGRIRPIYAGSQNTFSGLSIDYMLKDHLGNVRMLLTDEVLTTPYPAATMEPATIGDESKIYSNLTSTQTDKPSWFNDPLYSTSTKVARLKNAAGSAKVGPSIILKVMAGDTYNIRVTSGWSSPNSPFNYNTGVLTDLLNQLINGLPSVSGGKATSSDLQNSGTGLNGSLSSYINQLPYSTTTPKAYLNWVLLDEQFKIAKNEYGTIIASGYSGFDAVDANGVMKTHVLSNLPVAKSGYLVIYTSNEASNIDVYFDNLQVTHTRGPILEETNYYPFGLTMGGISNKALNFGRPENKKGYNGNQIQNKEFSDGSGLEIYDFNARTYNYMIGRFIQVDPLSEEGEQESLNSYHFTENNPIRYNDPDGKCPNCVTAGIGAAIGGVAGGVIEMASQLYSSGTVSNWSAVSGAVLQGTITGAAAGFTGGASLLTTAAMSGAANAVGGVANRAIQGQATTFNNILSDVTVGSVLGAGGKLVGNVVSHQTNKLSNSAKGKLGETVTKVKYSVKGYVSKGVDRVKTGTKTATGKDATANFDHKMINVFSDKKITVESKFNSSGLTQNQSAVINNGYNVYIDRTTSEGLGNSTKSAVVGAGAGLDAQRNKKH